MTTTTFNYYYGSTSTTISQTMTWTQASKIIQAQADNLPSYLDAPESAYPEGISNGDIITLCCETEERQIVLDHIVQDENGTLGYVEPKDGKIYWDSVWMLISDEESDTIEG